MQRGVIADIYFFDRLFQDLGLGFLDFLGVMIMFRWWSKRGMLVWGNVIFNIIKIGFFLRVRTASSDQVMDSYRIKRQINNVVLTDFVDKSFHKNIEGKLRYFTTQTPSSHPSASK